MAIGLYFNPESMTTATYDEISRQLDAAGEGKPAGRLSHVCFGPPDKLQVFDIWESQQDIDRFSATLLPILREMGIDPGKPAIEPVHNLVQG